MDIPEENKNMDNQNTAITANYTISEVADKLHLSTKTLRRWEESGKFRASRTLGNQRRYSFEDLQILDAIKHNIIPDQSDLLTLLQASQLCQVSPSTIERWVKEGKIHPFITSGKTYYPKSRLLAKLDKLQQEQQQYYQPQTQLPPPPQPSTPQPSTPKSSKLNKLPHKPKSSPQLNRWLPLLNLAITILMITFYHLLTHNPTNKPTSPQPTPITQPLPTPTPTTNPNLTTQTITLTPIAPPNPAPGTIYFDAGSQSLRLFTDTWINLAQPQTSNPSINLKPTQTQLISGTHTLKKGTSNTLINNKYITPSTPIIITFTSDYSPAKKYWLEQINGSFTLHTDFPVGQNSTFTYLILAPSETSTSHQPQPSPSPTPLSF